MNIGIALLALLGPATHGGIQPTTTLGPRLSVWVSDFENKISFASSIISDPSASADAAVLIAPGASRYACPTPDNAPAGLAEMAITEMLAQGNFDAVERAALQNVTDEQQRTGVADASKAQQGKLMGAQLILRGALTEFSYSGTDLTGSIPMGFMGGSGSYTARVDIDVRLIDATTGEIYAAAHGTGGAKSTNSTLKYQKDDYRFGRSSFQTSPLAEACRQAIKNALALIAKQTSRLPPWSAKVAQVDSKGNIYINAGKNAGLQPGDVFEVFHPGESIPDPDNPSVMLGESTGEKVGKIRVTEVLADRLSRCEVVEGTGYASLDRVKVPKG